MDNLKWDRRFLKLAYEVSTWSKDPSTQVGAVIANGKEIVSLGYNGLPEDIEDTPKILNDRDTKLLLIVHAEENAFRFIPESIVMSPAKEGFSSGFTIYTYPFMPCSDCAQLIIEKGISRVVTLENSVDRWKESMEKSKIKFFDHRIEVTEYPENFDFKS